MLNRYKWVFITGLILWCLFVVIIPSVLTTWRVYRHALIQRQLEYIALPAVFLAVYIVTTHGLKPSPKARLYLQLSLLALFFSISWFMALNYGIVTREYLWSTMMYTITLSTVFTLVFMTIAQRIHCSRRKTIDEYIREIREQKISKG
ncbi:MAG: hypothetical protein QXE81_04485 [Desulfurococcaceae archaeon]